MKNRNAIPMFIAEVSANHLGDKNRAIKIIEAAARSGVNAVKFQTYTAATMTIDSEKPQFKISEGHELWGSRSLFDLYSEAQTPWEWHEDLFQKCRELNVIPFSTPFDLTAVDFLESLNAPMYKIASLETGDHALIRRVAQTGKPLIISTGATTLEEIKDLVQVVNNEGNKNLTLLVCTSSYPAAPKDSHINRMRRLREDFDVKVGLSDHTLGIGVSIAAIALGASVIEKHITIKRADGGADAAFSLEPQEFADLVSQGKNAFEALGDSDWSIQESEKESRRLRRSLYVVQDVKLGDLVTEQNIRAIRPGGGAPPKFLPAFLGKYFNQDITAGTPLESSIVISRLQ